MTTLKHWTAGKPWPSMQLAIWLLVGVTKGLMVMLVLEEILLMVTFL